MTIMDEKYAELLKVIGEVEAAAKAEEVNFIDTSGIEEITAAAQRPRYLDMLKVVYGMEAKLQEELRQQQHQQQARPQQEAQIQQERAAVQRREPQIQLPRPNINLAPIMSKGAKGITAIAAQKETVKRELGSLARELGALETKAAAIKIKRINTKALVLPNLSVSDQVTELERIAQGIKENVFDQDQLSVIRQEVLGLSQVARESGQNDALSMARDQRLSEVLSMLNG